MNVVIHFADPETGLFVGESWSGPSSSIPARDGLMSVDITHVDRFDWLSMRVDLATGKIVDYRPPAPPDTEYETFSWDTDSKRWVATPTLAAHWRNVRTERDRRLAACDWVVARSSERGERVPLDWTVYRQALRDITQQDDPLAIRWPEPPA